MPEFRFTVHPGQDEITDGMFMGHLDVVGNSGEITTRESKHADGGAGLVVFQVLLELLDGVGKIIERGRGTYRHNFMVTITFKLKRDGTMVISRRGKTIDESPSREVAHALLAAGREVARTHLSRISEPTDYVDTAEDGSLEYRDYRPRTEKALARFEAIAR
ncbi:hypothetical protein [Streptomyces ochraceiscleroticus]|uniref:Uncharacterized protein n=1 Tax=Streptomyces ochraceiscleroticus TaxID=47761 RepID=A0ABW1MH76_9ACTN|nr:hypothetical protein [Streptomyces ochraceiscleroticus]